MSEPHAETRPAVPPIYQPEVAADAIMWASKHPRRELWIGGSTVATILGQWLAPGLLDRYLALTGYEAQQTDRPENPGRPDNLFRPVDFDMGAHGTFNDRALARSVQWSISKRRDAVVAGGAAAAFLAARRRRR